MVTSKYKVGSKVTVKDPANRSKRASGVVTAIRGTAYFIHLEDGRSVALSLAEIVK